MNSLIHLFLFHTLGSKPLVNAQNRTGQTEHPFGAGQEERKEGNETQGLASSAFPVLLPSPPLAVPQGAVRNPRDQGDPSVSASSQVQLQPLTGREEGVVCLVPIRWGCHSVIGPRNQPPLFH